MRRSALKPSSTPWQPSSWRNGFTSWQQSLLSRCDHKEILAWAPRYFHSWPCGIEAITHRNPSTLVKRNFSYRTSPVLRATLRANLWSHRLLIGIKWEIWTLSFHRFPLIFCGLCSLGTTASQSQAFCAKVKNAGNLPDLLCSRTQIYWHLFFKRLPFLDKWG